MQKLFTTAYNKYYNTSMSTHIAVVQKPLISQIITDRTISCIPSEGLTSLVLHINNL